MNNYDDIINLPHWEPSGRKRMSMTARAAQFAPFAALKEGETSGHGNIPESRDNFPTEYKTDYE